MTAPALVILAHGSRDPRSAATVHALVKCLRDMRDDLRIEASFLARLVAEHRVSEDRAHELIVDIVDGSPRRVFKL